MSFKPCAKIKSALNEEDLSVAWDEDQAMTLEQAITYALNHNASLKKLASSRVTKFLEVMTDGYKAIL